MMAGELPSYDQNGFIKFVFDSAGCNVRLSVDASQSIAFMELHVSLYLVLQVPIL